MRLLERILPVSMKSHELDAVNQARSAIGDQIRLPIAPASQYRRPLACPAEVQNLPAGVQ
jgi:hypothetical protein